MSRSRAFGPPSCAAPAARRRAWCASSRITRSQGAASSSSPFARALSAAVDALNERYGRTVVGLGHCGDASSAAAGYAGAKIAYGRIPDIEDFR